MRHIHLIGIGGTGISSIARVLVEKGYTVSGSDRTLSQLALDLRASGVTVYEGHAAQHVHGADLIVRSSAIPDSNIEVLAARELGIPVMKRAEFLGLLMQDKICIAVAGSHGKTTTSTMMAWTLDQMGMQPGYILGGVSKNLETNANAGNGRYFVIEADEYDYMFLGLNPSVILLTNVEYDHPDCYPTVADYQAAFVSFVKKLQPAGLLVTNVDQDCSASMIKEIPSNTRAFTYGLTPAADFRAVNLRVNERGGMSFDVLAHSAGTPLASVELQVPGKHNVCNALGVLVVHHALGHSLEQVSQALSNYSGSGRRFEVIGEVNGITIIDDYAHHPSKIKATLAAACSRYSHRRIVAVWQPHTYSRTLALQDEFVQSFRDADLLIVTDIYASREKPQHYPVENLVDRITYIPAFHIAANHQVTDYLLEHLVPGDVLIVLSAGDADQICRDVMQGLKERIG